MLGQLVGAFRFDGSLNWGDIGGMLAGVAAAIGLPLIFLQVRETRRIAQGEALLQLLMRLQDEENLQARRVLYQLPERGELSDKALLSLAPTIEPILRLLDVIALLIYSGKLYREPFAKGDWAEMVARCWENGEPFIQARRRRDQRPNLWWQFERLGVEARRATRSDARERRWSIRRS